MLQWVYLDGSLWKLNRLSSQWNRVFSIMCFPKELSIFYPWVESVYWLLATIKELLEAEASKKFTKSSRVGSKAYIV